jgi:RNA polymerase sigma factor (sigma-70 family)
MTKDFRVEVKVKNNRLLEQLEKAGFESIADFSRKTGINQGLVGDYANMKEKALTKDGQYKPSVLRLSEALKCMPEDLFPTAQLTQKLATNKQFFTANESELFDLTSSLRSAAMSPERQLMQSDANRVVKQLLLTLTPREQRLLDLRFGLTDGEEKTLDQVADLFGIHRERVRQIQAKAMRKMKHPFRSRQLREYYEELTTDPTE